MGPGGVLLSDNVTTSQAGAFSTKLGIPVNASAGVYTLEASSQDGGFASSSFTVTPAAPINISSLQAQNAQGVPTSAFKPGQGLMIDVSLQSQSGSSQGFLGATAITNAAGQVIYIASEKGTVASGGSTNLSFILVLPYDLPAGEYRVTVFVWNGYPANEGAAWEALAEPVSTTIGLG